MTELIIVLVTFLATSIGALLIVYIRKVEKVDTIDNIETRLSFLVGQVGELVKKINIIIDTEHQLDKRVSHLESEHDRVRNKIHEHSNEISKLIIKSEVNK